MKRLIMLTALLLLSCAEAGSRRADAAAAIYSGPVSIASSAGVNIHGFKDVDRELPLLKSAGFRFVRIDLTWDVIERYPGRYDWSVYDALIAKVAAQGLRPLLILAYSNPVYEPAVGSDPKLRRAPVRPLSMNAFSSWAATAAKRYARYNPVWEIWNEPNHGGFWSGKSNPDEYIALAQATCTALRAADPAAMVIGPAFGNLPTAPVASSPFMTRVLSSRLPECLDAISVHPYLHMNEIDRTPAFWGTLRARIAALSRPVPGRPLPVPVNSEWGLASAGMGVSDHAQGSYLARMMMHNAASKIQISVWYSWMNGEDERTNYEHNFGLLRRSGGFKPAFYAMRTLFRQVGGYTRICQTASKPIVRMEFSNENGTQGHIAVWKTAPDFNWDVTPQERVPVDKAIAPHVTSAVDMLGNPATKTTLPDGSIELSGGYQPYYLKISGFQFGACG